MKLKNGFSGERSLILPQIIVAMMEKDPVASPLHITDLGYYPKASHHFRQRDEPINQFILIYCIDGCGWYEVDSHHFEVTPNQYFILPAGVPHTYAASEADPWTIYWIHFKGTMAPHYVGTFNAPRTASPGVTSRIRSRNELFEEIFNTLNASLTLESIRYAMGAFHHYLSSLVFINEYRRAVGEEFNSSITQSIIHYLTENLEKHLTLKDLADFSGYSQSHISAIFKEQTGHSPLNYFNLLKIRQACHLLETTDMKLNQISYKLGISDQFYFSRLFTRIMGMSPSAYRTRPKT